MFTNADISCFGTIWDYLDQYILCRYLFCPARIFYWLFLSILVMGHYRHEERGEMGTPFNDFSLLESICCASELIGRSHCALV